MSLEKLDTLLEAYTQTEYSVPDLGLSLFVGRSCAEMDRVLGDMRVTQAIILTASNPLSVLASDEMNTERHHSLKQALSNYTVVNSAYGHPIDGDWPAEQSVCVLGMEVRDADTLADQFNQLGYVLYMDGRAWLRMRKRQVERWLSMSAAQSG